ncbi:MAG: hypothetical protein GTO18_02765 [Anaerolineales bacterium]|nr:hypothetical protein [Anaerolineales bacterium]
MNQLLKWLKEGDLTSDGFANEVVSLVEGDLTLMDDLIQCLEDDSDVVRGHTADALEKLTRANPAEMKSHLQTFIRSAQEDPVAMVRWHMAMILGHLSMYRDWVGESTEVLIVLLSDKSVFTISWSIVSLCIIARQYPAKVDEIVRAVAPLEASSSTAIRSKVRHALPILTDNRTPFPKGWIKSEILQQNPVLHSS